MSRGGGKNNKANLTKKQELELEIVVLKNKLKVYETFARSIYRWTETVDKEKKIDINNIIEDELTYISNLVYRLKNEL